MEFRTTEGPPTRSSLGRPSNDNFKHNRVRAIQSIILLKAPHQNSKFKHNKFRAIQSIILLKAPHQNSTPQDGQRASRFTILRQDGQRVSRFNIIRQDELEYNLTAVQITRYNPKNNTLPHGSSRISLHLIQIRGPDRVLTGFFSFFYQF